MAENRNTGKGPDEIKGVPDPLFKPNVPPWAEKARIQNHIRYVHHPLLLNAIGGPLAEGPKEITGVEFCCPLCKFIFLLPQPGREFACPKCDFRYLYTAVKSNTWLWLWKAKQTMELKSDGPKLILPTHMRKQ